MKTTLEVLVEARAMIKNRRNWCQGALSRGRAGFVQHCARGAVDAAMGSRYDADLMVTLAAALPADWKPKNEICADTRETGLVVQYNNSHTHAQVLNLFDRAIASEREKLAASDKVAQRVRAIISDATKEPVTA